LGRRRCGEKRDGIAFFIGIIGKVSWKMLIFADYAKEKIHIHRFVRRML
jgi:hypothetical protein